MNLTHRISRLEANAAVSTHQVTADPKALLKAKLDRLAERMPSDERERARTASDFTSIKETLRGILSKYEA